MSQKYRGFFFIDRCRANQYSRVFILSEHALLTAREDEALEIDSQRQDCKSLSTMKRGHVAEKKDAEMTPSFGPILIHRGGRSVGTEKALIIIGDGHSRMGA